jgi:hypothetical protein
MEPIAISDLLDELGFHHPEAQALARQALEAAGLTRPGKRAVAPEKRATISALLEASFLVRCQDPRCIKLSSRRAASRRVLPVGQPADCAVCRGSANLRAATALLERCKEKHLKRLVVVGGSPKTRGDLAELLGDAIEVRLVDGTERRSAAQARQDISWADLVLVWGSTELDHSVSTLYTQGKGERKVLFTARRGVAALFEEALTHLG